MHVEREKKNHKILKDEQTTAIMSEMKEKKIDNNNNYQKNKYIFMCHIALNNICIKCFYYIQKLIYKLLIMRIYNGFVRSDRSVYVY